MAKNKVILTFFLVFLTGFSVLCGCGGDDMNSNGLSDKTEKRIIQDCVDNYNSEVWGVKDYYGTYNGWVVVRLNLIVPGVVKIANIGGFDFNILPPIISWKDGQIHELKDVYVLGLLTQDDLKSIHVLYST